MLKPMLAKDADIDKVGFPLVVQFKYDGIRALVGEGVFSRTLKKIPNKGIQAALSRPEFEGFDGEIVVGDPTAPDCYRRTASFVMAPDKTGEPWVFYAFDLWDRENDSYMSRRSQLAAWAASPVGQAWTRPAPEGNIENRVEIVTGELVKSNAELTALEETALADGHEGLIARVPQAPYKHGRSGSKGPLVKVKRFIDFEAEVIGVFERMHNGNEAQTNELGRTFRSSAKDGKIGRGDLGGLVLRALNGPHKGQEFRCGTGFNDEQRAEFWADTNGGTEPGTLPEVAKIKSFPIGSKDAPRFPVFLGWRDMEIDG